MYAKHMQNIAFSVQVAVIRIFQSVLPLMVKQWVVTTGNKCYGCVLVYLSFQLNDSDINDFILILQGIVHNYFNIAIPFIVLSRMRN